MGEWCCWEKVLKRRLTNGSWLRALVQWHINILQTQPARSRSKNREGSHNGVRVRGGTQFLANHTLNQWLGVSIKSNKGSMGVDGNTPEVDLWSLSPGPPRQWIPQDRFQSFSAATLSYSTLKKLQEGHCWLATGTWLYKYTCGLYTVSTLPNNYFICNSVCPFKSCTLFMKMLCLAHENNYVCQSATYFDHENMCWERVVFDHWNMCLNVVLCPWNMFW